MLTSIQLDKCKCRPLLDFVTPKDVDIFLMEKELMADGGLCGSHRDDSIFSAPSAMQATPPTGGGGGAYR